MWGGRLSAPLIRRDRAMTMPRPLLQSARHAPAEVSVYSVTATLTDFRRDEDGDDRLLLSDESGRTMIAAIPAPECAGGSPFASQLLAARQAFDARFSVSSTFQHAGVPIELRAVGFFNYLQDQ